MNRCINPLRALSLPFASNESLVAQRRRLEDQTLKGLRVDNAAWLLAHAALTDKDGLDPVAVALSEVEMAQNRRAAQGLLEQKLAQRVSAA